MRTFQNLCEIILRPNGGMNRLCIVNLYQMWRQSAFCKLPIKQIIVACRASWAIRFLSPLILSIHLHSWLVVLQQDSMLSGKGHPLNQDIWHTSNIDTYVCMYVCIENRRLPVRLCSGSWIWSKCSNDDVTRAAASAWQFFVLVLQWVLSQRGQFGNAPLVLDSRVSNYVIIYKGP